MFQNFKTYNITGFQVRAVDEKFKSDLGADIEIILGRDTSVLPEDEDPIDVPFTPVPLNEIKKLNPGTFVGNF